MAKLHLSGSSKNSGSTNSPATLPKMKHVSSVRIYLKRGFAWTLCASLLVIILVFQINEVLKYRSEKSNEARVLANIISLPSANFLSKKDLEAAHRTFQNLEKIGHIKSAALYFSDGKKFVEFLRHDNSRRPPTQPKEQGFHFGKQSLTIFEPVMDGGLRVGTLFVEIELKSVMDRWTKTLFFPLGLLAIFSLSLIALYFYLNRNIVSPLVGLTMQAWKENKPENAGASPELEGEGEIQYLSDRIDFLQSQANSLFSELDMVHRDSEKNEKNNERDKTQINERLKYEITIRKQAEDILKSHYQILELLSTDKPLNEVLDLVASNLEKKFGPEVFGAIYTLSKSSKTLTLISAPNLSLTEKSEITELPVEESNFIGATILRKSFVIAEDISLEKRWNAQQRWALLNGFRASWSIPIADPRGSFVGVIVLLSKYPRSPSVEELKTIKSSAFLAGLAIIRNRVEEDLKDYAEELARSNQDLQDFASIASHDLQEPLRKITAFGGQLKSYHFEQLDPKGQDFLDRMIKATARMQRFISDLLVYSRAGSGNPAFVPTDLNLALKDVLFDLEFQMEKTKAQVDVAPLPVIEADGVQIHQVFQNLIGNSLKFTPADTPPKIEIKGEELDNGNVRITVRDYGVGFDDSFSSRIFRPFERLSPGGHFEGSGIGLALCKKIVEHHLGHISAKSQPGEGTCITLELPLKHKNKN